MTSAPAGELCRITVFGPSGRADLAVPLSTTVAGLVPALVAHVVRDEDVPKENDEYGSWVLQQLGGPPLDPNGTPETLNWLNGEQFHLVPADDPLPELDFDDVADGMATAISRQPDRWNPAVNRKLFLGLAIAVLTTVAVALFDYGSRLVPAVGAGVLAAFLLTATVLTARSRDDRPLAVITGLAGCGFAGLAGSVATVDLAGTAALEPFGVLVGALVVLVLAAGLLVLQRTLVPMLPIVPFGAAATVALGGIIAVWLHSSMEMTTPQNATLVAVFFFLATLFAPKLATRAARLRGPQLPRTAEELQIDVEPAPAAELVRRTAQADRYLSFLAVGASFVFSTAFGYLLAEPIWLHHTLTGLLVVLVLLRAREFLNIGQRVSLAVAGAAGAIMLLLSLSADLGPLTRTIGLVFLAIVAALLVLAALRPPQRRLLPIWAHLGNILETCAALAVLPFLLQLLGVYAWARGLAG